MSAKRAKAASYFGRSAASAEIINSGSTPRFFAKAILAVADDSVVTTAGGNEKPPFLILSGVGACTCFAGAGVAFAGLLPGSALAAFFAVSFSAGAGACGEASPVK